MGKLLDKISKEFTLQGYKARSVEARRWLESRGAKLRGASRENIIQDPSRNVTYAEIGLLHMFFYIPKLREELPYYDKFPLVLPIEMYDDGWLGINFHYLPINLRIGLLDKLYDLNNNDRFNASTRIEASYALLKGASRYREFKPCLKRYLFKHVQSRIIAIEPQSWEIACFLPVQVFAKAGAQTVWADSRARM